MSLSREAVTDDQSFTLQTDGRTEHKCPPVSVPMYVKCHPVNQSDFKDTEFGIIKKIWHIA